ncbi:Poxvirus A32 protein [Popillia japonica]|uniref:Poxvirus A32 protein n=1 Tax=Popillia japonica TaxID=7064 RepID=A0AAW1N898_POPJA
MKFLKQKDTLNVLNFDNKEIQPSRHGSLLPNTVRSIIVASSGGGKTNLMLSLLFDENGLKFDNVYVYSKSLYQPKYQLLSEVMNNIKEVTYFPYRESDDILDPEEAQMNSIFIFDDVACDKQDKIRSYFSMGRHKAVDCFYLCQSYARIPKHLIRDNANFLIIFKQDELNLKHIYDDHVGVDMTFETFKEMCGECWNEKYGFLIIDKDRDVDKGRYRKNFDCFIII